MPDHSVDWVVRLFRQVFDQQAGVELDVLDLNASGSFWLWIQLVDATDWLIIQRAFRSLVFSEGGCLVALPLH